MLSFRRNFLKIAIIHSCLDHPPRLLRLADVSVSAQDSLLRTRALRHVALLLVVKSYSIFELQILASSFLKTIWPRGVWNLLSVTWLEVYLDWRIWEYLIFHTDGMCFKICLYEHTNIQYSPAPTPTPKKTTSYSVTLSLKKVGGDQDQSYF